MSSSPKFLQTLAKSRFFTVSALLHFLAILIFGGTVLFHTVLEPDDFEGEAGDGGFVPDTQAVQAPQVQTMPQPTTQPTVVPVATSTAPAMQTITTTAISPTGFQLPSIAPSFSPSTSTNLAEVSAPKISTTGAEGMTKEIAAGIKGFTEGWAKGKGGTGTGTGVRQREFEFTAYLAKYSGGDWGSTVRIEKNKVTFGSLPNLLYIMQNWSRDKIKTNYKNVEAIDLASDQLFAIKPPFIFFTGHRDFTLTEKEVENLRKYLRLGGAIWGDSSLPGLRSRFDIAFRREMKRVVGDIDKEFEPLPADHPIFDTRRVYYPEIKKVPAGINFYEEPVFALKVYGEIAVLYTANDYGDMWQFGLDKDGKFDQRRNPQGQWIAMNRAMYNLRETYYRNITEQSVTDTYKFGTNVVIHLLTRWEDKVRNAPRL